MGHTPPFHSAFTPRCIAYVIEIASLNQLLVRNFVLLPILLMQKALQLQAPYYSSLVLMMTEEDHVLSGWLSRVRFPTLPDFSEQQWVWNGLHSAS
jgi:hypothetical protein